MQKTIRSKDDFDFLDHQGMTFAVPKEKPKIEVEFGDLPPFQHIAKGNRQAKGRARLLKILKRKAVTMSKRVLGRRLTDDEMRRAKGAAVQWMATEMAAV
jgi:hypothetical protein